MKVCILSSVHLALDNRIFYREARSLINGGFDVTILAIHNKSEIIDGIHIIGLPNRKRWKRPFLWWKILILANNESADIYHFHDPELLLISPIIKFLTNKPIIYDIHEAYPDFIKVKDYLPAWVRYTLAWLFKWLEPLLARFQDGLIFSDGEIAKSFKGISIPKVTLYNFPSSEFIEKAIKESKSANGKQPIILYLGGLERNRGTRLMIEAFDHVHQKRPDAKLLLVGHFMPPELVTEVEADIKSRHLNGCVTITGRIPFANIGDYLQKSAIGWLPWQPYAKNEKNIPTKLFEYMAYGLPIVSSSLGSTEPFIQDGKNGYLVTPNDPDEHAKAILKLLDDDKLASEMGNIGQNLVYTKYNWNEMESKLLNLYQHVLQNSLI